MKKVSSVFLVIVMILSLAACGSSQTVGTGPNAEEPVSEQENANNSKLLSVKLTVSFDDDTVSKDEKFGAALLSMGQEEFEALGFRLGDAVAIDFQNGYAIPDVPYFNGYYVRNGEPVMVAYPGDPYIRITLNNMGIWDTAGLKEGDTVMITQVEEGKYLPIQEALGQIYSFDRSEYPSDEAFCNFRSFSAGCIKEDFMYRGASPVDNSRNRAPYVDSLLEQNGIRFVIDLADSEEDMNGYMAADDFSSEYVKGLYENGCMVLLDMGSSYTGQAYKEKVVNGLRAALEHDGPIYIHCMEGKDRTGFVCLLLEALAGAGFDEMKKDYMTTYGNYFGVTEDGTPEKYDAIVDLYFVPFMEFLHGTDDLSKLEKANYKKDARDYLSDGGMTNREIRQLIKLITK
ncbi:MAG: tyrosine-protein phosphatase [Oscillospiraceae bacterium]|nr:tyrosine-protein phosphatase [Oscillospiraceae bacterium]